MADRPKKGDKIIVVEGARQGEKGIVSQVRRVYDEDAGGMRWIVYAESLEGGQRIRTRLSWVRQLES